MKTVAPLVFGFVLLFAFGLMLVSFRSMVIAAKAVVSTCSRLAQPTGSSSSSFSMAGARSSSVSSSPAGSTRSCHSCSS